MTEPLPPRSAIVETCRLLDHRDPELSADNALKDPEGWFSYIKIARRLAELAPHLYPADPDLITLAVREIVARCAEEWADKEVVEVVVAGERDDRPYCTQGRAVIEKLIEELKP